MDRTIYDGLKREVNELQNRFDRRAKQRAYDEKEFQQRQARDRRDLADLNDRLNALETVLRQHPEFDNEAKNVKSDCNELLGSGFAGTVSQGIQRDYPDDVQYAKPQPPITPYPYSSPQGDGDPGYPTTTTNPVPNFVEAPGAVAYADTPIVIELRRIG